MSELIIQRTILQTIDSYGTVRNLDGPTVYYLDGDEIDKAQASDWLQGQYVAHRHETPVALETLEPGIHEHATLMIPTGASVWYLVPGYPLDAASKISQISANTTGQSQFIVDGDDRAWVIHPDPHSPDRSY